MHALTLWMIGFGIAGATWGALSAFMFTFEYWTTRRGHDDLVGGGFAILGVALAILSIIGIPAAVEHTQCHDITAAEIDTVRFDLDEGCMVLPEKSWDGWGSTTGDGDNRRFLEEATWREIEEIQNA